MGGIAARGTALEGVEGDLWVLVKRCLGNTAQIYVSL